MASIIDNLSEQAKTRIEIAADRAESDLLEQLTDYFRDFGPESLQTNKDAHENFLESFVEYASRLLNAYAEAAIELFSGLQDLDKYLRTLRTDVIDEIVARILPTGERSCLNEYALDHYWEIRQQLAFSPSGVWESTLQDCWADIKTRNPVLDHDPKYQESRWEWAWHRYFQHVMRKVKNREPFAGRLKTHLEIRIPGFRANYREHWNKSRKAEPVSIPTKRRYGPEPDIQCHRKVADVVSEYGADWKTQKNIAEICKRLDKLKIPVPKTWKPTCKTWKCKYRRNGTEPDRVKKAIEYRVDYVKRHPDRTRS